MNGRALRRLSRLLPAVLAADAALAEARLDPARADEDIAIVLWLQGEVSVQATTSEQPAELSLFDRLSEGSVVRTSAGSEVTLVLLDGRRVVLEEESALTLAIDRIEASEGSIRWLAAVPELKDLAPLARAERPGPAMGASRLRETLLSSARELAMDPSGDSLIADDAELRFEAQGRGEVLIEVTDAAGRLIFETRTKSRELSLPPGLLEPGRLYFWQVSQVHGSGQVLGDALFRTLSVEESAFRKKLIDAANGSDDTGLEMILVAVDLKLGLHREACRRLESSAAKAASSVLDSVLTDLGCQRDSALRLSGSHRAPQVLKPE